MAQRSAADEARDLAFRDEPVSEHDRRIMRLRAAAHEQRTGQVPTSKGWQRRFLNQWERLRRDVRPTE